MGAGHCYPARNGGMASDRLADLAAKGFAELGHEVLYELHGGASEPLPDGVELVSERRYDVDVMYLQRWQSPETRGVPWVLTYHAPRKAKDPVLPQVQDNWIFVSETHARSFGRHRYVTDGIDPGEFIYSETKDDYFLFAVADLADLEVKGFAMARLPENGPRLPTRISERNRASVVTVRRAPLDIDQRTRAFSKAHSRLYSALRLSEATGKTLELDARESVNESPN